MELIEVYLNACGVITVYRVFFFKAVKHIFSFIQKQKENKWTKKENKQAAMHVKLEL